MDRLESKLIIALVGLLLLVTGTMWLAFFPPGGLLTALLGVGLILWAADLLVFGGRRQRRA